MRSGRLVGSSLSLLVLLVAPALTSCSLLFVRPPPSRPPETGAVECTTSVAAPVIDGLIAGLQIIRVFIALGQEDSDYDDFPISRGADVGFGVAFAAIFGGSAAYGFRETSACSALERKRSRSEAPGSANVGCSRDDQCKGDRICEAGSCVQPGPVAARATPRIPAAQGPIGAFGHRYGTSLEAVREACTARGGVLSATGTDVYECRLTVPLGGDAPIVSLRFCANTLCEADATYAIVPLTLDEWVRRFDRMQSRLQRQLGAPVEQRRSSTSWCASDYPNCFSAESPDFSVVWKWPNRSQVWLRSTPEGMVRLTFTGPPLRAAEGVPGVYE